MRATIVGAARWLGGTSLRRELMIVFLACGLSGLALATYFWVEYQRLSALAGRLDTAGQLRMLSQRALVQAQATAGGAPDAGSALERTRASFDRLLTLQYASLSAGRGDGAGDGVREGLDRIAEHWRALNHSVDWMIGAARSRQAATPESMLIALQADLTLAAAEANVQRLLPQLEQARARIGWLPPFALLSGFALVAAMYVYIRQRLLEPVTDLGRMLGRIGTGDLRARVAVRRSDEIGVLLERANRAAQTLEDAQVQGESALARLRDSEVRHRTLWEIAGDAIVVIDHQGTILFANPSVDAVFGYAPQALVGCNLEVLQPADLRAAHREGFQRYVKTGVRRVDWSCIELRAVCADGREIEVEVSFSHMRLSDADLFVGTFRDVTQRKRTQAQLRLTNRAIAASSEGIMITDARAEGYPILYANPALAAMTGCVADDLLGRPWDAFLDHEASDPGEVETLRRLLGSGKSGSATVRCRHRNGQLFWNELSVAPVTDAGHAVTHYITVSKDVTERRRQEEALVRSATFDALTGLPNRVLLHDRIDQAIASARRHQRAFGLLYVDLDNFKVVNDSLGHESGDLLLCEAASRLLRCVRDGDTVARIAGDEFVVLLEDPVDESVVDAVAARLLEALGAAFDVDGREAFVGASIGVAIFPRDGETRGELLQHADIAMFRAKEQGRNNYQFYAQQMQQRYQLRLSMESQLRRAADNGELLLHYQPQVELATRRVVGVEALARWESPSLGRVPPAQFIPLAEETGLIVPIGEWILRQAAADLRRWTHRPGGADCRVSVNLSARQFGGRDLLALVRSALDANGLRGAQLELEVTESLVMRNPQQASDLLHELRALGCQVAIDDFGTGYSSLAYLRHFPLDSLKIDRSLIADVAIVQAVVQLARNFGLRLVAEGVEDAASVQRLHGLGCDVIQGYYYAKPLPFDALVDYLASPSIGMPGLDPAPTPAG